MKTTIPYVLRAGLRPFPGASLTFSRVRLVHRGMSLIFLTFSFYSSYAATKTAVATGKWETRSTWSTGTVPTATDSVVIPAGLKVTVSATGDVSGPLTIRAGGTLTINSNVSLSIGGTFTNAGSFTASSGSTLTFNGAANTVISGGGTYLI